MNIKLSTKLSALLLGATMTMGLALTARPAVAQEFNYVEVEGDLELCDPLEMHFVVRDGVLYLQDDTDLIEVSGTIIVGHKDTSSTRLDFATGQRDAVGYAIDGELQTDYLGTSRSATLTDLVVGATDDVTYEFMVYTVGSHAQQANEGVEGPLAPTVPDVILEPKPDCPTMPTGGSGS